MRKPESVFSFLANLTIVYNDIMNESDAIRAVDFNEEKEILARKF